MHSALANFVPSLRAHHHLASGAALVLDPGHGGLSRGGNAIVFGEHGGLQADPDLIPLVNQGGAFSPVAELPGFRIGLFGGKCQLQIREGFMQPPLAGFEGLGVHQAGEFKLFDPVDFLLAKGELMFESAGLAVALHVVELGAVADDLEPEICGIGLHPTTGRRLPVECLQVLFQLPRGVAESGLARGNLLRIGCEPSAERSRLLLDILQVREFGKL